MPEHSVPDSETVTIPDRVYRELLAARYVTTAVRTLLDGPESCDPELFLYRVRRAYAKRMEAAR